MALTVIFALAGSMVLSLTLMPVLASLLLPKRIEERGAAADAALPMRFTIPFCDFAMHHKLAVLGLPPAVLIRGVWHDRAESRFGVRAATCPKGPLPSASSGWREPIWTNRSATTPQWNGVILADVSRRSRTRLEPRSAPPKSPPIRWASN